MPEYTSGQLSRSAPDGDHKRGGLTWEPNLLRYQSPEILPPLGTLRVIDFQGMHVVDLALSVNDSPRVRRPERRIPVSSCKAQFGLHDWSQKAAYSEE